MWVALALAEVEGMLTFDSAVVGNAAVSLRLLHCIVPRLFLFFFGPLFFPTPTLLWNNPLLDCTPQQTYTAVWL